MVQTYTSAFRSAFLSKPPVVIFMISLLAFAVTTFTLSIYVSSTENIPNPDVLSWNSLLVRIAKLEFCLRPHPSQNDTDNLSRTTANHTVSISVPLSPKFLDEFRTSVSKIPAKKTFLARGEIPISKLGRHLSRYEGQTIYLSFEISSESSSTSTNENVCLLIGGSESLISYLNSGISPGNCSSDALSQRNVTILNLSSHSQEEVEAIDWCDAASRNETPMILEFEEQPEWSVFVSAKDKEMMQLHLMVCFSVLAVLGRQQFLFNELFTTLYKRPKE